MFKRLAEFKLKDMDKDFNQELPSVFAQDENSGISRI